MATPAGHPGRQHSVRLYHHVGVSGVVCAVGGGCRVRHVARSGAAAACLVVVGACSMSRKLPRLRAAAAAGHEDRERLVVGSQQFAPRTLI